MSSPEVGRLKKLLKDDGVRVIRVADGPRNVLKVELPFGGSRDGVPDVFEGRRVLSVFADPDSAAQRFGVSPAFPNVVHEVRKAAWRGGGWVVRWKCERGRGEVYGAVLMTEVEEGTAICRECTTS